MSRRLVCDGCLIEIGNEEHDLNDSLSYVGAYIVSKDTDDHNRNFDFCSFEHLAKWAQNKSVVG